ncbi:BTB/POZ domain-containing protein At5g41330-like [Chenopodium quinoa]|uniref:BTB domain-containing protein n=1 Tax=Chenopodium quinoa TaxID=63459 RepID=A0A803LQF7_CHEQI|nr:BTB/POZ domain-containing protein At5g41330-like [Chenopodium quinoa]
MNSSIESQNPKSESTIVTLNVGGELFQTTQKTLTLAGPNSFLSTISSSSNSNSDVPFIDRDPQLFSIFLSLLRTGILPLKSKNFHFHDLISESQFYGIEPILINSLSNPSQFNPLILQKSLLLPLNGRDSISAISTTSVGSVHVAHGSKITSFDWSLSRKSTILTEFVAVDSLLAVAPDVVAAGATDFCGLQIIDLEKGFVRQCLNWENSTRSSSNVQAIGSSNEHLFTSFESSRRNSNAIVVYDLLGDFRPVFEIARNEIYGADFDSSTIPATKLSWVSSYNMLMASGSHSGPTGVVGCIKLWDVRSGNVVWEMKEKVDCFADVAVSSSLPCMFKVGTNSGEVFFLDLRNLGSESEWVCLGNLTKLINSKKEGLGCKVECHGSDVFVSKGGDIELWSEVLVDSSLSGENVLDGRVFRRTLMGRAKDMGGDKITNLRFGGNKMFATRKDQQLVEVWQGATEGL